MRRFVGWFEAKQHFNTGPRDDPLRNATVNYLELAPSPVSTPATPEKHQQFLVEEEVKKIEMYRNIAEVIIASV